MPILFEIFLIALYNNMQGDNMVKIKYKVIDYVTPAEACTIIGISASSTPQITRWVNEGKIKGVVPFGKNKAIPVAWVKSECLERGINWEGVELKQDEIGVYLKDYIPIKEYCKNHSLIYINFNNQIARGYYNGDFIRFGNTYGLPK